MRDEGPRLALPDDMAVAVQRQQMAMAEQRAIKIQATLDIYARAVAPLIRSLAIDDGNTATDEQLLRAARLADHAANAVMTQLFRKKGGE